MMHKVRVGGITYLDVLATTLRRASFSRCASTVSFSPFKGWSPKLPYCIPLASSYRSWFSSSCFGHVKRGSDTRWSGNVPRREHLCRAVRGTIGKLPLPRLIVVQGVGAQGERTEKLRALCTLFNGLIPCSTSRGKVTRFKQKLVKSSTMLLSGDWQALVGPNLTCAGSVTVSRTNSGPSPCTTPLVPTDMVATS